MPVCLRHRCTYAQQVYITAKKSVKDLSWEPREAFEDLTVVELQQLENVCFLLQIKYECTHPFWFRRPLKASKIIMFHMNIVKIYVHINHCLVANKRMKQLFQSLRNDATAAVDSCRLSELKRKCSGDGLTCAAAKPPCHGRGVRGRECLPSIIKDSSKRDRDCVVTELRYFFHTWVLVWMNAVKFDRDWNVKHLLFLAS